MILGSNVIGTSNFFVIPELLGLELFGIRPYFIFLLKAFILRINPNQSIILAVLPVVEPFRSTAGD